MIVFSFINLKGGVGKTTISTNVAVALSMQNAKILFIDNDEQSNSSLFFNVDEKTKTLTDLYNAPNEIDIYDIIYKTRYPNIDCIPAGYDLNFVLMQYLQDKFKNEDKTHILKNALNKVKDDYDICIIDNHPGINIATYNALMVTNSVIIVTTTDLFSQKGLLTMKDKVNEVKEDRMNFEDDYNSNDLTKSIRLEGCLVNKYINNPTFCKDKELYFNTNIRLVPNTKQYLFDKANIEHKSYIELSPRSRFAKDIYTFCEELMNKILGGNVHGSN